MKVLIIPVLVCTVGCGQLRTVNRVGLAISMASLACDFGSTAWHANRRWVGYAEANPIIGPAPDMSGVVGWFALMMGATLMVHAVLPDEVKPAIYVGVTARETYSSVRNYTLGTPMCGVL